MRYSFDHAKQASNVAKHGIFFSAADEFEWETALVQVVSRGDESRLVCLGLVGSRVHVLVVTLRDNTVRIISLRKASRKEVKQYVEAA